MTDNEIIEGETTEQPDNLPATHAGNPLDVPTEVFNSALERRGENRQSLIHWVRSHLVEDVDFGKLKIGGKMTKPSLFKPGAEKICGMLGVTATFPNFHEYEQAALEGKEIKSIILRCHLVDGHGHIVADGIGARSMEQDKGDLNKALKMACKSAHIDATLRMAGLSEVFTQDIEDMKGTEAAQPSSGQTKGNGQGQDQSQPQQATAAPQTRTAPLTESEVAHVRQLMNDTETNEQDFLGYCAQRLQQWSGEEYDIPSAEYIPPAFYDWCVDLLKKKAKKQFEQQEQQVEGVAKQGNNVNEWTP